ncbi:GNAT family N-acetyltransferase [Pseudonocardia sp. TRM90224]|uniref:GNAT family N-acetyltransferase n=1 Tax=Pseudonocardia sp. TRM90224 TaxID=2812678 RepID=UPI0035A92B83
MPVPDHLTGRKVRLREVGTRDRRALKSFDRDAARSGPSQVGDYRHWGAHRSGTADPAHFGIETLLAERLVGSICATGVDPVTGRFSYGIGVASQHQRCGYASDAITTLLRHMFWHRGFRTCEVSIYSGNLASLSLHGVLGFREEHRLPDTEMVRGKVRYLVQMGITAEEFAGRHPRAPVIRAHRGRHWRARRGQHWGELAGRTSG